MWQRIKLQDLASLKNIEMLDLLIALNGVVTLLLCLGGNGTTQNDTIKLLQLRLEICLMH